MNDDLFRSIRLNKNQTLYTALAQKGLASRADCGGLGQCGQCQIRIQPDATLSPLTELETERLEPWQLDLGYRLACQTRSNRLQNITISTPSDSLRIEVTAATEQSVDGHMGLAIDLGTTRVTVLLCDLETGKILASASGDNAQRSVGDDVISRITASGNPEIGLQCLRDLATETINRLTFACLEAIRASKPLIQQVAIAGNTTMSLILAGIDPRSLGVYPYEPEVTQFPELTAEKLNLGISKDVPVFLFPAVSGFIGGDTVSALIADGALNREETSLIIDIGTNGEILLCCDGELLATSCATGPAFAGARISCGMPAMDGAIDMVTLDPVTFQVNWHVIGSEKGAMPKGLCGSGLVDAVAELYRAGILSQTGLLEPGRPLVRETNRGPTVELVPSDKTDNGSSITLTQKDIGEVQLAKAALCAGIQLLLLRSGTEQVDRTILTGAFGSGFKVENAAALGMLPPGLGQVSVRAGLVEKGAMLALTDRPSRELAKQLSERIKTLDLGGDAEFEDHFLSALEFSSLKVSQQSKK